VGVIIACCAAVDVVRSTVLSTAEWALSLLAVLQLMLSTLQDLLPQVGVIIAYCATVVVIHFTVLSTAGASHHCLLCCS